MKKKNFNKRLKLNKSTISNLNNNEMTHIIGADRTELLGTEGEESRVNATTLETYLCSIKTFSCIESVI